MLLCTLYVCRTCTKLLNPFKGPVYVDSKNSKTSCSETQTFIDFYFYLFSSLFTLSQFDSSFKLLYSNQSPKGHFFSLSFFSIFCNKLDFQKAQILKTLDVPVLFTMYRDAVFVIFVINCFRMR